MKIISFFKSLLVLKKETKEYYNDINIINNMTCECMNDVRIKEKYLIKSEADKKTLSFKCKQLYAEYKTLPKFLQWCIWNIKSLRHPLISLIY